MQTKNTLFSTVGSVAALLLSIAFLLMGNGLQGTLLPVRGSFESFSNVDIGIQGTFYFLGFTIGCLLGPVVLRRGGHIRTFMAMASVASVTVLLHAMILEATVWALLRSVTGFCFAVLYVVIESWLNEKSSNENRGTVFSIYTIINLTVVTIGQLMIGLASPGEFVLFGIASILVSVSALPLAFTTSSTPGPIATVKPRLGRLYRLSPVGFVGCLAVGLANGAFWSLAPIFAQSHGMDVAAIGVFMSAVVLGGAVAQWPLGALSDRMDRRRVLAASAILAAIAGLLLSFAASDSGFALIAFAAALGAGAMPLYAISVAHAADHAKPEDMVEVSSGLLLIFGLGAVAGPVLASLVDRMVPFPALFAYTAVIHILLTVFVLWRLTRRGRVDEEERVRFAQSAVAAQTLSATGTEAAATIGKPPSRNDEPDRTG